LLKNLIAKSPVQFSESFEVDGAEIYKHACSVGLEGVVSKVRDSRYASGRSNDWVKKTCAQREILTIAGFVLDGSKWDGLYLGKRKGKDLIYAGKVDHGFDTASAKDLQSRLKPLIRKTQPYAKKIAHRGIWVEPSLLAESSTGRSQPRAKCATRSSKASGRIYDPAGSLSFATTASMWLRHSRSRSRVNSC
jgi:bifunctional non-homologous end joining protein LigD